jgi:hypothetical protein
MAELGRIRPDDEACTEPLANATPTTDADPLRPFGQALPQRPLADTTVIRV